MKLDKAFSEKIRQVNQQYEPIKAMINSIPHQTVTVDGEEYPKAGGYINAGLLLVVHHCINMKNIGAEFERPFSKSELKNFITAPFTEDKLNQVKALVTKYEQLDEEAYRAKGEVA